MRTETVYSRFAETAGHSPGHAFLNVLPETAGIYQIDAGEIPYRVMLDRVENWRHRLREAGFGVGHRVGLLLQNRPIYFEIWFALNSLGASVVPINPDLRLSELEYIIGHSGMDAAFVLPDRRDEPLRAAHNAGQAMQAIVPGERIEAPASPAKADAVPDSATEAALLYTSGTTGNPKGCVLSNEYFLHSGNWYRDVGGAVQLQPGSERMLTPCPYSI